MSIKLFVTDLDGTLLPSGKDVPCENIEAVQQAVRAGVIVTIATGRMYRAALPVAEALGIDVPIITYNGAFIKSTKGKVYHTSYLKPEVIEQVVDFCQEQGWYLQSYSRDELWVPVHDEHAQRYEQDQKVEGHVVGWDGLREHTQEVCKLLTISEDGQETERRLAILNERFGADIVAMQSNARYGEIVNHASRKQRPAPACRETRHCCRGYDGHRRFVQRPADAQGCGAQRGDGQCCAGGQGGLRL